MKFKKGDIVKYIGTPTKNLAPNLNNQDLLICTSVSKTKFNSYKSILAKEDKDNMINFYIIGDDEIELVQRP